jgi:hypothetical chaperone protein
MRCGIDFGTSNTTMAVVYQNSSTLVPLENQSLTIPTAVFFPEDKALPILFGRAGVNAYLDGVPGRLMRSLKRILGTGLMEQSTSLRGQRWTFPQIVGQFLSHIKKTAEEHLQSELTEVTLGRPVHFQDGDDAADKKAQQQLHDIAANLGFQNIAFQFEPIAAALSHERNVAGEKLALVVDIGGGTSDFSVIRLSRDYKKGRDRAQDILANTGVRVGGNDADKAINLDAAMPLLGLGSFYGDKNLEMPARIYHELSEWSKINWCYTPQNINMVRELIRTAQEPERVMRLEDVLAHHDGHRILNLSEEIKIDLSESDAAEEVWDGMTVSMTQDRMNGLTGKVFDPVRVVMLDTLAQAGVRPDDIAIIVLTGGSTALPVFQKWVAEIFPKAEISQENRLGSVGLGLVL